MGCAKPAGTIVPIGSAIRHFFSRPIIKMPRPTEKLSAEKRYVAGAANCGIISPLCRIGPAIRSREEGYEHQVVQEPAILRHALLAVDQVTKLGEGEER